MSLCPDFKYVETTESKGRDLDPMFAIPSTRDEYCSWTALVIQQRAFSRQSFDGGRLRYKSLTACRMRITSRLLMDCGEVSVR